MYYKNGNKYEGEWKKSKKEGKGIYYYKNGNIYDGEFKDGKKEGNCRFYYSKLNTYQNQIWKNDHYEKNP